VTGAAGQVELRHGLLLGGGRGSVCGIGYSDNGDEYTAFDRGITDYQYNALLGYKLRFRGRENPLFFDTDIQVGLQKAEYSIFYKKTEATPDGAFISFPTGNFFFCNLSVGLSVNYNLYKGLFVGAGVDPTYRLYQLGDISENRFDVPVIGKIGYNMKYVELALVYKKGIMNSLKTDHFERGKLNDWQLQLFIPF
jgi:hypothetical protein